MLTSRQIMPAALLTGQVISMLSIIPLALYGTWWQWLITFTMFQCIVTIGISMGYHRYLSHKSFKCPRWFEYIMTFFATIMMVGSAVLWVATHREHHAYTDTEKDPHSPKHKGWFYAHFLQVLTNPRKKFMTDILRDQLYRDQHKYYWHIIGLWGVLLLIIDPFSIIYAWLAPAGLSKLCGSLVFSYSHRNGQPNTDAWVALVSGGEGYHTPHHLNPRQVRWGKFDFGGVIIEKCFSKDITA